MQNLFSFDQRRSNIHISVTDDQKLESPLGPYYAENSTFLCGRRAEFETVLRRSKPRVTFVSPPSTCLNATPNFALEGSKSTCVGGQRLPVRSAQPRVMQNENLEDARDLLEKYRKRAAFEKIALLGPALDITTGWGPRTAFGNPA